ncbi:tRNA (adenosine(37)-N6)-dimethylallyltransferase MiaA [Catellatospora tritici]|uniref:tRNA (adenosine(37)-N6)-dimethylallyltransferase MiaA n=1 Tax=Catellatospora tritici TaxID=2851566 RepID=UPI001C2D4EDB|nr:tRNA (adenosine(37)-N6)-dimethylallyltransferase MiaA [Catellatospora tritici]MBV1848528.1 tRNA (adenosine(37)-N6)-dimethylallyltransferase MiaA [Catellatospora tritici]MBV1851452.1 tRNA (adenosine(37)-N6)-dimethylallyltransferase MiaA [Catellatospora tritici]
MSSVPSDTGQAPAPDPVAPEVVAVVGPTAAGKSALSIALAHALRGEVVNCDSMQVYRGMDIGTAKLTEDEREGVPHHLLDLWPVTAPASVAEFQRLARAAIDDIRCRGKVPLLVGGSGLYQRAVLEDFDFPGTDPAVRARLEAELEAGGPAPLHARLAQADPVAAAKILPSNGRRIVRALEVIEITGQPFTASLPEPVPVYRCLQLAVDRADLDVRVEQRVDRMWAAGFVDEVRGLLPHGLDGSLTASRALGYQQVLAFLRGECEENEAHRDTVTGTRRFVRRQRSWLRRDPSVRWLDGAAPDLVEQAIKIIDSAGGVA